MKTLKFMLAAATAIGIASVAQAVQYKGASTGFEKLELGTKVITGTRDNMVSPTDTDSYFCYVGENVDDNESEIVAFTDNATSVTRPTGVAKFDGADKTSRANALQVSTGTAPLLRTFAPVAGSAPQAGEDITATTYVDTLVQFTVTPSSDTVTPGDDDKLMIYLKETATTTPGDDGVEVVTTSTNLVVKGGYLESAASASQKEYAVQNIPVEPGVWYRLTVEAIPASVVSQTMGSRLGLMVFRVKINGVDCVFGGDTINTSDQNVRAFFMQNEGLFQAIGTRQVVLSLKAATSSTSKNALQAVGFAGEGLVDDLVITTTDPAANVVNFTLNLGENVSAVDYTVNGETQYGTEVEDLVAGAEILITSITYDEGFGFASYASVGLTGSLDGVAGTGSFTVDGGVEASLTINAKPSASAGYPEYIPAEDATVKGLYDAWKANVAGEGDVNTAQNQFLLNTAASNEAATGDATLKITSIEQNANGGWDIVVGCTVEGVKLTGSVDSYQVCNGYLAIEYASELGAAAWTKENIAVSAVDAEAGTVTVNVNKPEAKFLKAELSLTKAPTVE